MASINVCGWYGHANIGDESYKLSFPKVFEGNSFAFSEKPLDGFDVYILGGGDIACDSFMQPFIKRVPDRQKRHMMSVAISQPNNLIREFSTVATRDFRSISNAAASGVHAQYVPDFAFALEPDASRGKDLVKKHFKESNHELYSKLVVVVINAHLVPDHAGTVNKLYSFMHMAGELGKIMDHTSASFLFIPFSTHMPWDDRISNSWVANRCKFWKKNSVIYDVISPQDTIDIISYADAVISTRLHSSIFSCLTATPFIDITHNHKNKGFLEALGLTNYSVKYEAIEASGFIDKLKTMIGNLEIKNELERASNKQKTILKEFSQNVHFSKSQ